MTFFERVETYPPCLMRLLAKSRYRILSAADIAQRANLATQGVQGDARHTMPPFIVESISQQTNWRSIDIYTLRSFVAGCGFDFDSWESNNRLDAYIRSVPNFDYLRRSNDWATFHLPLLLKWRRSYPPNLNDTKLWKPMLNLLKRLPAA